MAVATEASYAERSFTGTETVFTPGFSAADPAHVLASYFDASGLPIALTPGVHFSVALDSQGAVTVTRIAFPSASPAAPVTIAIERDTPAVQGVDFNNLAAYDASVHERIADAGAMRDAELRNRQNRTITPFSASLTTVDFRPRQVRAGAPLDPSDLATKLYADTVSGSSAQAGSEAARDISIAQATIATTEAGIATGAAQLAGTYAAILANPDDGLYSDVVGSSIDDGTYP